MKVYILTEGGNSIGYGHITRCSSFYQGFRDRGITPCFVVNGNERTRDVLKGKRFTIFDWTEQPARLLKLIEGSDIVIIDSYLAARRLYEQIARSVKLPVYIDDNIRLSYPRGIVVNGTLFSEDYEYPQKPEVLYLLGSRYMPLRKEFWDVPKKSIAPDIRNVLLTFGGEDPRGLTPVVLKCITEQYPSLKKLVIIGRGFSRAAINAINKVKDKYTVLSFNASALAMRKAMLKSDLAISASGQTLYELARAGVPTIAVLVADNQLNNVKGWKKAGAISFAGPWNAKGIAAQVVQELALLRSKGKRMEMSRKGKATVDGGGTKRIIELLLRLNREVSHGSQTEYRV